MPSIELPDSVVFANGTNTETVRLSGGRTVVIRQATGMDMMRAQKQAGDNAAATEQLYALLARCIAINGKAPKPEEIARMSLGAIRKITEAFNKLNDDVPDPELDSDGNPIEPPA
jgi:hypothetical protein